MKISDALAQAKRSLDSKGVSSSKLDALILLAHTLSFSKEQIIFNPNLVLDVRQQADFFALLSRRKKREPISHIIGKREFFGEDFFVTSAVLDPRPDSETIIEFILQKFPQRDCKLNILEIGVGSGCLIITLLLAYKAALGTAVDISNSALEICLKNSKKHQTESRLQLLNSDLFSALPQQKFDLIISNPPYIASQEIPNLEAEVKFFEPISALDGGLDGLNFYRRIASAAKEFLKEDGRIFLEIGYGQQEQVTEIFTEENFILIATKPDLSGIVRVLEFGNF